MANTIEEINTFTDDYITRCFEHPAGMEMDVPLEDRQEMASLLTVVLDTILEKAGGKSKWDRSCHYECQGKPMAMVDAIMKKPVPDADFIFMPAPSISNSRCPTNRKSPAWTTSSGNCSRHPSWSTI